MPGRVKGRVTAYGPTGNLVTDISAEALQAAPRDESTSVKCDEFETRGLFGVDHGQPAMTFLAILGEAGVLELTLVGDSVRDFFHVPLGTSVEVSW